MCIFNSEVIRVSNTQILVTHSTDGKRQLTVYSNKVNTAGGNAMILPVPKGGRAASVRFHDLSAYPNLFEDCAKCFAAARVSKGALGWGALTDSYELSNSTLRVHDVGSYRASIVPTLDDFSRLDASVFSLSPAIGDVLRQSYGSEFEFIVCQLQSGSHEYHPFAYSHDVSGSALFVPTLHEHGHKQGQGQEQDPDWDHTIYSIGTGERWHDSHEWRRKPVSALQLSKLPAGFDYRVDSMNRKSITGDYPNMDLVMSFSMPSVLQTAKRAVDRLVEALGY
jgi:hypothetical protein